MGGLQTTLGWVSSVSLGDLMLFVPTLPFASVLFLLAGVHTTAVQAYWLSRAWLSSGPPVWKFTVDYFVLTQERRVHWDLGVVYCCDKNTEKKKGDKFVIVQDFKGFWSVVVVQLVALCLE